MTVLLPPFHHFHHFHHFCHFLSLVANTSPIVSCRNVPTALERCSNARGTIFYDLKIIDVVTIATFLPLFRRFFVAFRRFSSLFRCFSSLFLLFFCCFLLFFHHFCHISTTSTTISTTLKMLNARRLERKWWKW